MPDRILRAAILTSDSVNKLSWPAETFYRRLMSVVDDYGRYDGRVQILRSSLYPLKLNQVSDADIAKWADECSTAGLVSFYEVEGKRYLEILKFGQRLRAMQSKWPPPSSDNICQQPLSNASEEKPKQKLKPKRNETNPPSAGVEGKDLLKAEVLIELPWPGEEFASVWVKWKDYRLKEKRQKFKTQESELAQLKHLHELAGGDENKAILIINQSIGNQWQGLFELKKSVPGQNQKTDSKAATQINAYDQYVKTL